MGSEFKGLGSRGLISFSLGWVFGREDSCILSSIILEIGFFILALIDLSLSTVLTERVISILFL